MKTLQLPTWAWFTLFITTVLTTALVTGFVIVVLSENPTAPSTSNVSTVNYLPVEDDVNTLPTITVTLSPTATHTALPTQAPSVIPPSSSPVDIQVTVEDTAIESPLPTTIPPQPTIVAVAEATCTPPEGWESYTVQQGDTLFAFQLGAGRAGNPATVDEIMIANCLDGTILQVGQQLYLPSGAAFNAPPSEPVAPALPAGVSRTASCPCILTIQAGWRVEQIADQINRIPVAFSGADFLAVVGRGAPLPARDFLATVPAGSGLEGFMLPGTYTLQNDTTAVGLRDMVLDAFGASAAGIIANAQGMSPYEAVILASIIQRESYDANEQTLVSSVFYNRIATGRAFAATVTIQYALGTPGNWWPRLQSGQTSIDSPYNTYRFQGFTPTPISNPSISAIQAAVYPAQTNYIYFTGNCRGPGNVYAVTYEEHLANVECR